MSVISLAGVHPPWPASYKSYGGVGVATMVCAATTWVGEGWSGVVAPVGTGGMVVGMNEVGWVHGWVKTKPPFVGCMCSRVRGHACSARCHWDIERGLVLDDASAQVFKCVSSGRVHECGSRCDRVVVVRGVATCEWTHMCIDRAIKTGLSPDSLDANKEVQTGLWTAPHPTPGVRGSKRQRVEGAAGGVGFGSGGGGGGEGGARHLLPSLVGGACLSPRPKDMAIKECKNAHDKVRSVVETLAHPPDLEVLVSNCMKTAFGKLKAYVINAVNHGDAPICVVDIIKHGCWLVHNELDVGGVNVPPPTAVEKEVIVDMVVINWNEYCKMFNSQIVVARDGRPCKTPSSKRERLKLESFAFGIMLVLKCGFKFGGNEGAREVPRNPALAFVSARNAAYIKPAVGKPLALRMACATFLRTCSTARYII